MKGIINKWNETCRIFRHNFGTISDTGSHIGCKSKKKAEAMVIGMLPVSWSCMIILFLMKHWFSEMLIMLVKNAIKFELSLFKWTFIENAHTITNQVWVRSLASIGKFCNYHDSLLKY